MINMTGNAAASIALRNAIFRVIPRSYVQLILRRRNGRSRWVTRRRSTRAGRRCSTAYRRSALPIERVLSKLGKAGIEDIGLEDVEVLIGLGTAIKNGEAQIDDLFPPVAPAPAAPKAKDGKAHLAQAEQERRTGDVATARRRAGIDGRPTARIGRAVAQKVTVSLHQVTTMDKPPLITKPDPPPPRGVKSAHSRKQKRDRDQEACAREPAPRRAHAARAARALNLRAKTLRRCGAIVRSVARGTRQAGRKMP